MLVPAYNAADTIGDALESALTQRPAPTEVVVSDDGSEDDLGRVLSGFGDRIRVVRGSNGGLATARNRAAAVARGDLLGLLDADDVWLPGRVAALTEAAAARPDLSIVTTDAVVVRDDGPEPRSYYDVRHFETEDQETAILRNNFVFGAGAVRASALSAVGGYDPAARWAEDWDLWLRLLLRGHRAGMVRAPLYEYRRHGGSLTARKVDLALGVQAVLRRARPLVETPDRRSVLARTEREWAVAAVRSARAAADPRRRSLALTAARMGGHSPRAWARLVVDGVLARPGGVR
ncbi:glycosyltransferase family 2 protein [Geodermatophilus normandii]|uniref:Glycosyltransferase family 2 protein n=1 Tax=Geodermatophilus normandii TaxID=1137989 RepID=A0A6P0GF98_9ACTN|nr:glycosyltransferase family 2 protein [Geodermatophilus normandii]